MHDFFVIKQFFGSVRSCIILIVFAGMVWSLTISTAVATAPVPPAFMWFTFTQPPQAVQLIECQSLLCEQPVLLMQSGVCRSEGCLEGTPTLKKPYRFECAEALCLYVEPPLNVRSGEPYFKLTAQFSDRVQSSAPFSTNFRSSIAGYGNRHLIVNVQPRSLLVRRDTKMKPSRWEMFGSAIALTLISEVLVAALVLQVLKFSRSALIKPLVLIELINLLTFPIVWFFFPSLQSFQYISTRVFGASSVLIAGIFGAVLIKQESISSKALLKIFTAWVLAIPVVLVIAFVAAFILSYGEVLPSAIGLTSSTTFIASALFAVGCEAWLLSRCSENRLTLKQAGWLSLIINAVSLMVGLLVLPEIALSN